MTFDELVQEVYLLTNRPDMVAETSSAIKAATLKVHSLDYFDKDVFEVALEFASPSYTHSLDYRQFVTNWRALKYMRRVESADDVTGKFFDIIDAEEIFDGYGHMRTDVAYIAGRVLEMKGAQQFQYALVGCYVYPIVREGAYSSWIAEMYPYAIVYEAARVLFKQLAQDEQAAVYNQLVAEQFIQVRMGGLADKGY